MSLISSPMTIRSPPASNAKPKKSPSIKKPPSNYNSGIQYSNNYTDGTGSLQGSRQKQLQGSRSSHLSLFHRKKIKFLETEHLGEGSQGQRPLRGSFIPIGHKT